MRFGREIVIRGEIEAPVSLIYVNVDARGDGQGNNVADAVDRCRQPVVCETNLADDGRERGNSATFGIENPTGTVALQYSFNQPVLEVGHGEQVPEPEDREQRVARPRLRRVHVELVGVEVGAEAVDESIAHLHDADTGVDDALDVQKYDGKSH